MPMTLQITLTEWMTQWRKPDDDEQAVRGILGKLLFKRDQVEKSVQKLSGGEQGVCSWKLFIQPNILFMDEPIIT